jgi:hypothetical protein
VFVNDGHFVAEEPLQFWPLLETLFMNPEINVASIVTGIARWSIWTERYEIFSRLIPFSEGIVMAFLRSSTAR